MKFMNEIRYCYSIVIDWSSNTGVRTSYTVSLDYCLGLKKPTLALFLYTSSFMFGCHLLWILAVLVVCSFCGKDFQSLGHHSMALQE